MAKPNATIVRKETGKSGMVYEVKLVPDKATGLPTPKVQPGEIKGTPLTPIYEGD